MLIAKVPKFIAKWALTLFVWKCREYYQIAFFQWRRAFPSEVRFNINELNELIQFRIQYTYLNNVNKGIPNELTRSSTELPEGFLSKYHLVDASDK